MTLNFMQQFEDGSPTYFVEKITKGLWINNPLCSIFEITNIFINCPYQSVKDKYPQLMYNDDSRKLWDMSGNPKIHTIRSGYRWKKDVDIHFKIWVNKPYKDKTFNFAPIIKCISVQDIEIKWNCSKDQATYRIVNVDDRELNFDEVKELAMNDGFKDVEDFFRWFNKDFKGQVIHWTNLEY